MMDGLNKHLAIKSWCFPYETAVLTTPYERLALGFTKTCGFDYAIHDEVAKAVYFRIMDLRRQLASQWDRSEIAVGLS